MLYIFVDLKYPRYCLYSDMGGRATMLFSKLFERLYEKVYHLKSFSFLGERKKKCLNNTPHRLPFVAGKDYFSSCLYRMNKKQGRDMEKENSYTKQEKPGGRSGYSVTCSSCDNSWEGSRCAATNRFSQIVSVKTIKDSIAFNKTKQEAKPSTGF